MVKAKSSLLALIHQHLLKNGYSKSARELQIESGEKFATSKVTLQRVYKLWTKKAKKKKKKTKKQDGAKRKKPHDPKNSESSVEGHADIVPEAKKSSDMKAEKNKKVKKKMNLATEGAADVKVTPKKAYSLKNKPGSFDALAAAGGKDSSDIKEETVSANTSPVQAASLKSKPAAEKSDESSSSSESEEETTKQVVLGKTIPAPGAVKQTPLSKASNGKAEVIESSESSDETDIDKAPASGTSEPTAPSNVQPAKAKRQTAPPAQQVQADSTESSESDNEEESVKQVVIPTPKLAPLPVLSATKLLKAQSSLSAPQIKVESGSESSESEGEEPVKLDKSSTKAVSAVKATPTKSVKGQSKATRAAQASPVKDQLRRQILVSETESDSSGSEEETQKTPSLIPSQRAVASPLTPVVAAKVVPCAEETSEEESSDNEDPAIKKVPSSGTTQTTLALHSTPMVAAKAKSTLKPPQPAEESSEEESSDSDFEPSTKTPTTIIPPSKPKTLSQGISQTPLVASKSTLKSAQVADESLEAVSSDSDEAPPAKLGQKPSTPLQPPHLDVASKGTKQTTTKTPLKTPQPTNESSEEESDSDEEPAAKKQAAVLQLSKPKTPVVAAKQTTVMPMSKSLLKTPEPASESSEEDSDSDKEPAATKPAAVMLLSQSKTPSGGVKQISALAKSKSPVKTTRQADESSEEESDSEDEPAAKKPATVPHLSQSKTPSGGAKQSHSLTKSISTVKMTRPADESSEEESDSEEEPAAKKSAKALQSSQPKTSSGGEKQTTVVAKSKTPLKIPQPDSESSEEESDSDEEPTAKAISAAQVKMPASAPFVPTVKPSAAIRTTDSESSESSDTENKQVVTPTPSFEKSKSGKITGKLAKTATPSKAAAAKTTNQVKVTPTLKMVPRESSSESSDSESSVETAVKVNTPVPTALKAAQANVSGKLKTPNVTSPEPGKTKTSSLQKPKQADPVSSSESSDSEADSSVKVATKGLPKAVEQSVKTPIPSTVVKGKVTSLTQSPAVRKLATSDTSSSSSESDEEPAKKPTAIIPKPATQLSVRKTATPISAVLQKKQESSSEESDSDEEETVRKDKDAATGSLTSSQKSVRSKMSSTDVKNSKSAVPSTPSGGSKPEDSQTPTIANSKKRKRAPETARVLDEKKKEAKNKVQSDIIPVLPTVASPGPLALSGALLESEEETVLALLEGRSPKKTKKNKVSRKVSKTAVVNVVAPSAQNNNAPEKSPLPQPLLSSAWVPESPTLGDKTALPTTEVPPLSDKKAKKRKDSQNKLEKLKQKSAKKAKKEKEEKKIQKGMVEGANVSQKSKSDEKKSEKDRSKKKTKTKEGKKNKKGKKAESTASAIVESTDSGISLSKPKKKRKS